MPRGPSKNIKQFQKVLALLITGNPVSIEEIENRLGNEIQMYRISSYILNIKHIGGVVRAIKNGRNVIAYQLVNIAEMTKYIKRANMVEPIRKLQDLNAERIQSEEKEIA